LCFGRIHSPDAARLVNRKGFNGVMGHTAPVFLSTVDKQIPFFGICF
jgi:hypothetical protein